MRKEKKRKKTFLIMTLFKTEKPMGKNPDSALFLSSPVGGLSNTHKICLFVFVFSRAVVVILPMPKRQLTRAFMYLSLSVCLSSFCC